MTMIIINKESFEQLQRIFQECVINSDDLLTVAQVSTLLNVSKVRVHKLIESKRLDMIMMANVCYITKSSLDREMRYRECSSDSRIKKARKA